jgi:hypothetical protein
MLGRECPEAVSRDRALHLPTSSNLLIVFNTSPLILQCSTQTEKDCTR